MMSTNNSTSVIIVGAGICGISAAISLFKANIPCILLEADSRIGGRIRTERCTKNLLITETNEDDVYIDVGLGANWLHGLNVNVNPLYKIASEELHSQIQRTSSDDEPGDDVILLHLNADRDAGPINTTLYISALLRYSWMREQLYLLHGTCINTSYSRSLEDAFWEVLTKSEADPSFGPCSSLERECIVWFLDRICIDLAAPLCSISLSSWLEGGTIHPRIFLVSSSHYLRIHCRVGRRSR